MRQIRKFSNGILTEEIIDGVPATNNIGKTSVELGGSAANLTVQPIPRKDWPLWAKALAQFSKPEDKGIGDVVRRIIGEENSEAFKKWFKATTGKDCGCAGRHRRLNIEYPLP